MPRCARTRSDCETWRHGVRRWIFLCGSLLPVVRSNVALDPTVLLPRIEAVLWKSVFPAWRRLLVYTRLPAMRPWRRTELTNSPSAMPRAVVNARAGDGRKVKWEHSYDEWSSLSLKQLGSGIALYRETAWTDFMLAPLPNLDFLPGEAPLQPIGKYINNATPVDLGWLAMGRVLNVTMMMLPELPERKEKGMWKDFPNMIGLKRNVAAQYVSSFVGTGNTTFSSRKAFDTLIVQFAREKFKWLRLLEMYTEEMAAILEQLKDLRDLNERDAIKKLERANAIARDLRRVAKRRRAWWRLYFRFANRFFPEFGLPNVERQGKSTEYRKLRAVELELVTNLAVDVIPKLPLALQKAIKKAVANYASVFRGVKRARTQSLQQNLKPVWDNMRSILQKLAEDVVSAAEGNEMPSLQESLEPIWSNASSIPKKLVVSAEFQTAAAYTQAAARAFNSPPIDSSRTLKTIARSVNRLVFDIIRLYVVENLKFVNSIYGDYEALLHATNELTEASRDMEQHNWEEKRDQAAAIAKDSLAKTRTRASWWAVRYPVLKRALEITDVKFIEEAVTDRLIEDATSKIGGKVSRPWETLRSERS